MSRQLHRMGLSFDNRRTFATIDPGYVRWTQWIFSRIYDSWYDEDATNPSGSKGSARPIAELVAKIRVRRKRPFLATSPMASSGPTSLPPSSRIS